MKSNNTFQKKYEVEREKVEKKLRKMFNLRKPFSLYEPAHYIVEGEGKRLRPLLVIFSTLAVGGKSSQVYNAAVAVELLHNFTLVHDDIMDNADKRRGRLTLHKKYDLSTAILTGDILLAVAYEYLLKDCKSNSKEILASFTKGLVEVCEGQSLDKEFETRNDITLTEYIVMIEKKTAAMAQMCCEIGAYLGGGNLKEVKALSDYGKLIGIAFQIQDDLLDVTADEKKFGKKIGGDLVEGKKTYLFLKALEKAKGDDKKALIKLIKNKGIKNSQIKTYQQLYFKLGVIEDAQNEIISYTDKALKKLSVISSEKNREIFIWLANSLIRRSK